MWDIARHHCKEGWPSDSENVAKHPLIARPGWFSDESKRKTTRLRLLRWLRQIFFDDAATPPCGGACALPTSRPLDTGVLGQPAGKAKSPPWQRRGRRAIK